MISFVFIVILIVYVIYIGQLIYGFDKVKTFEIFDANPTTAFSIIVPFRNEEKRLPALLSSFEKLNYPTELFEIIAVDDFSTDHSETIFNRWRMKNDAVNTTLLENLRLSNSPKKDALSRAIPIVKHQWIITTDADCTVNKNWLLALDNFIQQNQPEMVVGAVIYKTKNNWFHHFQQLDLMSLQGTTVGSFGIGKPFMCNGANFAYTKRLFNELGGFGGINSTASGDDVMLLQKATKNHLSKIHYIKCRETIVKTKPENDLYQLFMQRVRWANKTSNYSSNYAKFLAIFVLLMNLSLVILPIIILETNVVNWNFLIALFLIKYSVDYILLYKSNDYLRKKKFVFPIASAIIYPIFCSLVGIYSFFGTFTWKGRRFRK